jgi:hypothetical protein
MNRNKLKTYAPAARRDFIQAVKDRAVMYGLSAKKIEPMTERGDVVLIAGQPFPKAVAAKRKRLEERISSVGFERAMEAIAYSWFNRFVAIRFMELHGYLDHGYRVLSHPAGDVQPEILEHAQRVDFPGLDKNKVVELKLDGTKQEELYRLLLVAQCNALSQAMPFLFERIDDETELLLPSNLLATDSLVQKLVKEIDEEDWKEVEILGWLYQFFISERKDEVIGKVVASEDIPAATQLFTPNWIVKYLVQNTLGRIWLATYPQSGIRQQMEFYIEPAEQTPEVQEQLKAITPTSLTPEELTLLDPACGSAHILVEAYDLFKAIYQERGYRAKDIPSLILSKNLFGLEIDDRAAQLAAFALLMKARADDRRVLESGVQPNVLSFVESKGMDAGAIAHALNSPIKDEKAPPSEFLLKEVEEAEMPLLATKGPSAEQSHVAKADIAALLDLFEEAKTCGSLIQIPAGFAEKLSAIEERLAAVLKEGDLTHAQAGVIAPLLRQAHLLARQYDAVVANPPYMGNGYFTSFLKEFASTHYAVAKADLYSCFLVRNLLAVQRCGFVGMITIPNWTFLQSFEQCRVFLLQQSVVSTYLDNGRGVFGSDFGSCAFTLQREAVPQHRGVYRNLSGKHGSVATNEELATRFPDAPTYTPAAMDFTLVPGTTFAYWLKGIEKFASGLLSGVFESGGRFKTHNDEKYVRLWWEVSAAVGYWKSYLKGGEFRRYFGNEYHVADWRPQALADYASHGGLANAKFHARTGLTCSKITASDSSFRLKRDCCEFSSVSPTVFPKAANSDQGVLLAYLNSAVAGYYLAAINPSITTNVGDVLNLPDPTPYLDSVQAREVSRYAETLLDLARCDWNSFEYARDFSRSTLLTEAGKSQTISESIAITHAKCDTRLTTSRKCQEEVNRRIVEAYGLQDELSPEVPDDQITLYRPNREEDIKRLLSYAAGCMMGRYSLDNEGLIYAHSGNKDFDPNLYKKFPADEDGIIPVTESPWFDDDAANRFERFVKTAWPAETLEENLAFVAESLGAKKSETPRETIRRYFASDFYKHHLQTYKNRPIYWLFSSGKQGAFEALVYLHRYNDGTLSRMRTEYVVPLLGKLNGRLGMLADVIAKATSTKQRKDAEKEKDKLTKQLAELQAFDDKLRHYADQRITLDLDDGVRVNYGKFGDLLADVKKVCGKAEED